MIVFTLLSGWTIIHWTPLDLILFRTGHHRLGLPLTIHNHQSERAVSARIESFLSIGEMGKYRLCRTFPSGLGGQFYRRLWWNPKALSVRFFSASRASTHIYTKKVLLYHKQRRGMKQNTAQMGIYAYSIVAAHPNYKTYKNESRVNGLTKLESTCWFWCRWKIGLKYRNSLSIYNVYIVLAHLRQV